MTTVLPEPDLNNAWRLATPGCDGWLRSARPDADDKYFMASADGHVQEPSDLWITRMPQRTRLLARSVAPVKSSAMQPSFIARSYGLAPRAG